MLFTWEIARLRAEIEKHGSIERFGDCIVGHATIRPAPSARFGRLINSPSSGLFRPPECIFGRPEDVGCLTDVELGTRPFPAHTIYTLNNASIIGTVAALTEEQFIFCDGLASTPQDLERLYEFNQSDAHGFVVTRLDDEFTAHFFVPPEHRFLRGRTIFFTSQEIGNFGCFLYWALPQLILFAQHLPDPVDQYVVTDRSPWVLEALEILGFPRRPTYTVEEVCGTRFESLCMTNVLSPEGYFHPEFRQAFRRIAAKLKLLDGGKSGGSRKLYVSRALSRARSPHYRALTNEPRIQQIVVERGFEPVFPETLSLADQIRLFDSAAIVIGPSGSGMLNAIFSPPGTSVVDLESFHVTVRQHARIYSSTEKLYSFCFGKFDPTDERPDRPMRRWQLDERDVCAALDWAEGAK